MKEPRLLLRKNGVAVVELFFDKHIDKLRYDVYNEDTSTNVNVR